MQKKNELKISASKYWVKEKEKYDLESDIYYYYDALNPTQNLEYLKSRTEKGDNAVTLNSYRIKAELNTNYGIHNFLFGNRV